MKVKFTISKSKDDSGCPPATQDLELNTKNRDASIKAEHIQYGPLNVDEPGDYWKDIAIYWNTEEKAAQRSLCGNCVAFDISPRMKDCMPGETSDKDGELGYCWMHHFKCHSARSCRTWAKGGPITEDQKSEEWQEKNKESLDEAKKRKRRKKRKKKKKKAKRDACYYKIKATAKVWPSAYASGRLVQCRNKKKGKKKKTNESVEIENLILEELKNLLDERKKKRKRRKKRKLTSKPSSETSLRDWFKRKGAKGKKGGWVDCNTCRKNKKTGRKTCSACGRSGSEKRAKYPSCRPTPAACGKRGRYGKKSKAGKKG